MYRESLDGLTERIRLLEAEKSQLEADVGHARRIRLPQRALRVAVSVLALSGAGGFGGAMGYRRAVVSLQDAARADARVALRGFTLCTEALASERSRSRPDVEPIGGD